MKNSTEYTVNLPLILEWAIQGLKKLWGHHYTHQLSLYW